LKREGFSPAMLVKKSLPRSTIRAFSSLLCMACSLARVTEGETRPDYRGCAGLYGVLLKKPERCYKGTTIVMRPDDDATGGKPSADHDL
jgi:hypothetical protein